MKKIVVFLIALILSISLSAQEIEQTASIRQALDNLFEHLDKSRVPTGYLQDYGTDLVDME